MPYSRSPVRRACQLRREHQEGTDDQDHHEDHEQQDLQSELRQAGAGMKDLIGDISGEERAVSHQQGNEGVRRRGQESQAAEAIRVCRDEVQLDP